METSLGRGLVRIWRADRGVAEAVGAGFLATDRLVLTCAHVVAQSILGSRKIPDSPPPGAVPLDFPLHRPASGGCRARTIAWRQDLDVALLAVDDPPEAACPLPLVNLQEVHGHDFSVYGFPGVAEGRWSDGVLSRRIAEGWVQMLHKDRTGYRVQPGYSGAPVWVDALGGVVGMVVASVGGQAADDLRTAFAIPTELLLGVHPEILENLSAEDFRRLAGITGDTAGPLTRELLSRYSPGAVAQANRGCYRGECDPTRRQWFCSALGKVGDGAAAALLNQVTADQREHELVKREARRALRGLVE